MPLSDTHGLVCVRWLSKAVSDVNASVYMLRPFRHVIHDISHQSFALLSFHHDASPRYNFLVA